MRLLANRVRNPRDLKRGYGRVRPELNQFRMTVRNPGAAALVLDGLRDQLANDAPPPPAMELWQERAFRKVLVLPIARLDSVMRFLVFLGWIREADMID